MTKYEMRALSAGSGAQRINCKNLRKVLAVKFETTLLKP
jgi:hypothetical protein